MSTSVAKVIEISAEHPDSFEAAVQEGIKRAGKTLKNMRSAWVSEQHVHIEKGKVVGYRVTMRITFVLAD